MDPFRSRPAEADAGPAIGPEAAALAPSIPVAVARTSPGPTRTATPGQRPIVAAVRGLGAVAGTLALVVSLSVAAGFIVFELPYVGRDAPRALWIIFIALAVALVATGVMYVSMRVYAKVVFAMLSVVLLVGGYMMLIFAPVLRQMNTEGLAEYRAFNALIGFGVLSTALGLALGAACIYWATRPHALARLAGWSRVLASAYGVMLGLSGLATMLGFLALINNEATIADDGTVTSVVEQTLVITLIAMWSFVPGLLLTYHGISASMGERSGPFRPPVAALALLAFGAVVALGQWNMAAADPVAAPMPVLHTLAAILPGITLFALASRGSLLRGALVRSLTWRQVTLAFALSMAVAATIAGNVNSLAGLGATVLMLVHHGAFEFAADSNEVFDQIGYSDLILSHNEQWVANLIAIAIVPPIIEEFCKGLSVRFVMKHWTTRAQAFALGAAAGAGFGFLEALLYGVAGVSGDHLADWWQMMVLRGGATSLHVLNTGLVGVAWWYWSIARRNRVALAVFGAAVFSHAAWNGMLVTLDSQILWLDTVSNRSLELTVYAIVAVVSAAFIVAIPLVARRLRDPEPPPVSGTALATMTPWIA